MDASVRRKLMRLLLSWQLQYSGEPTLRTISSLYAACGGGREKQEREAQKKRSEAEELLKKQEEQRRREMQVRMDRKTAEKLQKEEDKKRSKLGAKGKKAPARFNYEAEKPMILNHLAISSRSATALVNTLQHVNREKESVSANPKVIQALNEVKTERKTIVRYIQLCQEEDMLGALIEANDRIMVALQLYDKVSEGHHRRKMSRVSIDGSRMSILFSYRNRTRQIPRMRLSLRPSQPTSPPLPNEPKLRTPRSKPCDKASPDPTSIVTSLHLPRAAMTSGRARSRSCSSDREWASTGIILEGVRQVEQVRCKTCSI